MLAKIHLQSLLAELESLENIISNLPDDDIFMRPGYEGKAKHIKQEIEKLETTNFNEAGSALFFYGEPVVGSIGIEAGFGASVVSSYQELVSKLATKGDRRSSSKEKDNPQEKRSSKLFITNILHGSFGFEFKEINDQHLLVASKLKQAVEIASEIIVSLGREGDSYEEIVSDLQPKAYDCIKSFFTTIHAHGAHFKIISDNTEDSFDRNKIELAYSRVSSINIDEMDIEITGRFLGVLPESRRFEFSMPEMTYHGPVDKDIDDMILYEWNRKFTNKVCTAHLTEKKSKVRNREKTVYTLHDLTLSNYE